MNVYQAIDTRFTAEDAALKATQDAQFEAEMTKAVAEDYALGIDHGIWTSFNAWPVGARAACVATHTVNA